MRNRFDQQTFSSFGRNQRGARVSAFQDRFAAVEAQSTHRRLPVAAPALRCEQRPDAHLELFTRVCGHQRRGGDNSREKDATEHRLS
jgi:hypothetical protein